jgi:pimeloyl-ACP methyl ester carboxylesterase
MATSYDYQESAHRAVLSTIDHVRTRFRVDSDRIFLAGHGMGGDACFDIAMSHPGIFAGVIPINGISDRYCMFYTHNDPHVAWYVVGGQRDRETLERNARDMNKIMSKGQDVIYCDYKDRGYESYHEEQPRIFEWMETHRRTPLKDVLQWGDLRGTRTVVSLRKSDNRFYWLEANALRDDLFKPISWDVPQRRIRPTEYYGSISPGGSIYIRHPGRSTTLWLNPDMVNFDERIRININGESKFFDYVTPSIAHLLEELRLHGDRERLYWARIDL